MGDYTAVILDKDVSNDQNSYMFVVTPKTDGEDDPNAAWEGNLSLIKKTMEKGLGSLQKNMDKKIGGIQTQNLEMKARDQMYEKDSRNQYQRIIDKFMEVDGKFKEIEEEDRTLDI